MKKNKHFLINYFKPNMFVDSYESINIFSLKKNFIKMVICDLDNTLAPHFNKFPIGKAINFCNNIKNNGIIFVLASNNFKKRVSAFAEKLNPDEVIWNTKKPFLFKIKKIVKKYNFRPNEILFIGDQFLIDVFCANRLGAKSVLVFPLTNVKYETQKNKLLKFIEKYIYKKLDLKNYNIGTMDDENYEII